MRLGLKGLDVYKTFQQPTSFRDVPSSPSSITMADTDYTADYDAAAFDFKLYRYDPSLPAAIVSVVVFAILTSAHTWRLFRVRAYYFTAFTIGGLCGSPGLNPISGVC